MTETKQRLIASFQKSSAEVIRVHLVEWKGQTYVDIRVFYRKDDGTVHPTMKGVRFNVELLQDLRSALDAAILAVEDGPEVEIVRDEPMAGEESHG